MEDKNTRNLYSKCLIGFNLSVEDNLGSGGGSVGRAVASDTRDPRFESRHQPNFIYHLYIKKVEETKIKYKRPGMANLYKMFHPRQQHMDKQQ